MVVSSFWCYSFSLARCLQQSLSLWSQWCQLCSCEFAVVNLTGVATLSLGSGCSGSLAVVNFTFVTLTVVPVILGSGCSGSVTMVKLTVVTLALGSGCSGSVAVVNSQSSPSFLTAVSVVLWQWSASQSSPSFSAVVAVALGQWSTSWSSPSRLAVLTVASEQWSSLRSSLSLSAVVTLVAWRRHDHGRHPHSW